MHIPPHPPIPTTHIHISLPLTPTHTRSHPLLPAGTVTLPEGVEMVMPGDNVTCTFELLHPVAMEPGLRFAIREGGRTVGAGVVASIIE